MKKNYKDYVKNVAIPVLVYGALTGVVVGSAVYFFKLVAEKLTEWSMEIYHIAQNNFWVALGVIVGVIVLAVIMSFIHNWAPETKGGGIPRAEGVLRGILTFHWLRTAIAVVVNSFISFFAGLPLGSEGPSVLLGTSLGAGTSKLPLSHESWSRYIMTGGASAGFAVATCAPLTGILFAVEETHKRFTPMISLMAISSVIFGVVSSYIWGLLLNIDVKPLFDVASIMTDFAIKDIWVPVLLGIVVALVSCCYNELVFFVGKVYDTTLKKVPKFVRLIIAFVLSAIIGLIVVGDFNGTDALYGGGSLIVSIAKNNKTIVVLVAILLIRFFMIAFSTGSGVTGGVFIPMLSIGALLGGIMAKLFIAMGMDESLYATVVIISMSSFMGACTRAPITALVFVIESTWNFTNLFYVAIAVFTSYFICEITAVEPLYDVLQKRMIDKYRENKTAKIINIEYVVKDGAFVLGKSIRDILWPANTKISDIVRRETDIKKMDNDGEKKLRIGDTVHIQVQTYNEPATIKELDGLLGSQQ